MITNIEPGRGATSMQDTAALIVAESDLPPDLAAVLTAFLPMMPEDTLRPMMENAIEAKRLLSNGDTDGAREIIEGYRATAEAAGFGPIFDTLFVDIIGGDVRG